MTVNDAKPLNQKANQKAKISDLLDKLRNKLKAFAVIDRQGRIVGHIRELTLDKNRRLNLVISKSDAEDGLQLFLLSSKHIQKVDGSNRLVFVNLSRAEVDRLPVYQTVNEMRQGSATSATQMQDETHSLKAQSMETEEYQEALNEDELESDDVPEVVEEEIVRLLEERLVVNRSKRKIGEVVVRKEIETRLVQVPVQREILIVEQVGSETKRLAEIDLGEGEVTGVELARVASSESEREDYTVSGEFISPKAASNLLEAIALNERHGCTKVRVELVVEDAERQKTYQSMFDRCSQR